MLFRDKFHGGCLSASASIVLEAGKKGEWNRYKSDYTHLDRTRVSYRFLLLIVPLRLILVLKSF